MPSFYRCTSRNCIHRYNCLFGHLAKARFPHRASFSSKISDLKPTTYFSLLPKERNPLKLGPIFDYLTSFYPNPTKFEFNPTKYSFSDFKKRELSILELLSISIELTMSAEVILNWIFTS